MKILDISPELCLITLDQQKLNGFHEFIGAWLHKSENNILIDPGPKATIPVLSQALESLGIRRLDAILLTHIHIDHAGGTGDLVSKFPDTPVVCHVSGIPHLKDPAKLWEGSLKTLKKTAEAYGPIGMVPENLLRDAAGFEEFGVKPILTPGHAPHHVSYLIGSTLFAGETGGVFSQVGERVYLRPATPPKFFMETAVKSIDALLRLPHDLICYGHFGASRETPKLLELHKEQLARWADVISREMKKGGDDVIGHCIEALLKEDPMLAPWHELPEDIRERERFFFRNSVNGFLGYLQGK